jgi:hypothetical protein
MTPYSFQLFPKRKRFWGGKWMADDFYDEILCNIWINA